MSAPTQKARAGGTINEASSVTDERSKGSFLGTFLSTLAKAGFDLAAGNGGATPPPGPDHAETMHGF